MGVDYIEPHERVIIARDFHKVYKKIYDYESLCFFASYYYFYKNIKKGDFWDRANAFKKVNVDTTAMMLHIISNELGSIKIGRDSTEIDLESARRQL